MAAEALRQNRQREKIEEFKIAGDWPEALSP